MGQTVPTAIESPGKRAETTAEKVSANVIEPVGALGLGFCLMKTPVFAAVPKPWFLSENSDEGKLECGHDVHLFNQARSAGIPVHLDHPLSWKIGHLAEQALSFEGLAAAP